MVKVKVLASFGGEVDGRAVSYADGDVAEMDEASVARFEAAGLVQRIPDAAVRVLPAGVPPKAKRGPAVKGEDASEQA